MKLEELMNIAEIEKEAIVKDSRGDIIARVDFKNGFPPFLYEVEVDSIDFDSKGTVWIDLNFDSNLSFIEHMKSAIQGLEEDLSDEYRVSCPEDVNNLIEARAERMEDECHKVAMALRENKVWDYYLG